jgi:hypothetical protein
MSGLTVALDFLDLRISSCHGTCSIAPNEECWYAASESPAEIYLVRMTFLGFRSLINSKFRYPRVWPSYFLRTSPGF